MQDETRIKQEFAKAFGWYKTDRYSHDKEPITPSWEQIFVEVGKLIQKASEEVLVHGRSIDLEASEAISDAF